MSHITGSVITLGSAQAIGPATGTPPTSPSIWAVEFTHTPAVGGTKLLMLHFRNVNLPGANRLEVDLGYDTDVFTSADGGEFWTRPINVGAFAGGKVPVRYITSGAPAGSVQIDKYGRGERHAGELNHPSFSNSDPFLPNPSYTEPTYDPWWYCADPPQWENARCIAAGDIRALVARSVGMIVNVHGDHVSTCSVTLVDTDKVISAGHCHTPAEALSGSVIFEYETDCAGNRLPGYSPRFHKVKAALKQRWDGFTGGRDYSLLQLATAPAGIAPITLRPDIPAPGEEVFGIHHPNGAVKKISLPTASYATVTSSNATMVRVGSSFHVSGGSSGSGLFDKAGRIVGVLSTGDPCARSGPAFPLTYFPTATFLTDIALAPPPPITREVMLVIDRSGSMQADDGTGRRKIDAARDAVSLFVQLVLANTGNRTGLVSFSTAAAVNFAIANVTNPNKASLIGPPPYAGGLVGSLVASGMTSIGEGLESARLQFPLPGAKPRAILLLTDGLQNTPRLVAAVEAGLGAITVHAIGLGADSSLDGALLTALASGHGGLYTRASSGLGLLKFFSQAFGNIFEAGVLLDPEFALAANVPAAPPLEFNVCGEERLTVVVGWDRTDTGLRVQVRTPGGTVISAATAGTDSSLGRNWTYLRIPLPHGAERNGLWQVEVIRPGGGGEFPPPEPALRYFVNVIPAGGPRFLRAPDAGPFYTGDEITPRVMLRYEDGGWPTDADVELTVTRPEVGVGNLLSDAGLGPANVVDGDAIPARQSTLLEIEKTTGNPAVTYIQTQFTLESDANNNRGTFESAGNHGIRLQEFLKTEGHYTFHARARYGAGCTSTRELLWTIHVDVGIDPDRTDVKADPLGGGPDGLDCQRLTFTPRDKYGNRLGPGRADGMTVSPRPGSSLAGGVKDLGNGSYQVDLCWDAASDEPPGVDLTQPGRPPITVHPTGLRRYIYSVTFLCGEQSSACCECAPLRPGRYSTEINIHNPSDRRAVVIKRIIPLVLAGAVRGREPRVALDMARDLVILPPHSATMDDCCRLQELLLGAPVGGILPITSGILEIVSNAELSITAVYTASDVAGKVSSIEVESIPARITS